MMRLSQQTVVYRIIGMPSAIQKSPRTPKTQEKASKSQQKHIQKSPRTPKTKENQAKAHTKIAADAKNRRKTSKSQQKQI